MEDHGPGVPENSLAAFRRAAEAGYGAAHHNDKFDLNENVLKTGAISTVRFAVEWLAGDQG